jgi:hypothetical protein
VFLAGIACCWRDLIGDPSWGTAHAGQSITVRVSLRIRKRGGRKLVIAPDGAESWSLPRPRVDSALVKALARAFRWRKLIETGLYGSVTEIAAAEKINASYVARVMRLTLLAPEIVEAILDGRQGPELNLESGFRGFPAVWHNQLLAFRLKP